jgi:3-methyladenine DNA glycosylase AlkD
MNLRQLRAALRAQASAEKAEGAMRFFKTGPGEYGEGDKFLGLTVPQVRALVKQSDALSEGHVLDLLHSRWHEERLTALLIMVRRFEKAKRVEATRARLVQIYLANTAHINNWDLVDTSAPQLLGLWLLTRDRAILDKFARSESLWERRIAVVATQTFIREGQFDDTLRLARGLLGDPHDLMHKACGWMLREIGKKDRMVLVRFLDEHAAQMPRTQLRYAIENFPEPGRQRYLRAGRLKSAATV